MQLIRFSDQFGFILRTGRLGVAFFGSEWRLCVGWDYVADFRGPAKKAQRKWFEIGGRPSRVGFAKWKPI